jgi:hypothetical protein
MDWNEWVDKKVLRGTTSRSKRTADLGKNDTDLRSNTWHDCACCYCHKSCHKCIFDEVLALSVFPKSRGPDKSNEIKFWGVQETLLVKILEQFSLIKPIGRMAYFAVVAGSWYQVGTRRRRFWLAGIRVYAKG